MELKKKNSASHQMNLNIRNGEWCEQNALKMWLNCGII